MNVWFFQSKVRTYAMRSNSVRYGVYVIVHKTLVPIESSKALSYFIPVRWVIVQKSSFVYIYTAKDSASRPTSFTLEENVRLH